MYLTYERLAGLEERFGCPARAEAAAEFTPREFSLLEHCRRKDRAHDVTLLIRSDCSRYAVIRKPSYPLRSSRPPSGGVEPFEAVEAGAAREAREETGLEVCLERYLLRVEARFTCEGDTAPWTTHVLLTRAAGGVLAPLDCKEIAEARWASVQEMRERYGPAMLRVGSAGMRYRVDLQDWALALAGLAPAPDAGRRTLIRLLTVPPAVEP